MINEAASKRLKVLLPGREDTGDAGPLARGHDFAVGESVRSLTRIRNEGTYPHRDIGDILVREGDLGYVHESWSFLNEVYYTVEFIRHAVVVIMHAREMAKSDPGAPA